jgi:hypothetical protein
MKIAICYSGQYRPFNGWKENHKNNLPSGDYYYSTWNYEKEKVTNIENMIYFEPPLIDWNLYKTDKFLKKHGIISDEIRSYTACLQHLGHWFILNQLQKEYDIIIRMRYDSVLGNHKNKFEEFCEMSYKNNLAIGIGGLTRKDNSNKSFHIIEPIEFDKEVEYILDYMIIHKQKNIANVDDLYKTKSIFPSQFGWHQILSQPAGFNHKNYKFGVQLSKFTELSTQYNLIGV